MSDPAISSRCSREQARRCRLQLRERCLKVLSGISPYCNHFAITQSRSAWKASVNLPGIRFVGTVCMDI